MKSALRWTLVPALLVTWPALAPAQRMGPAHFGGAAGFRGAQFHHQGFRGAYHPFGYFNPLYSDYLSERGYATPSEPHVIVLQSPQPAPPTEPAPAPSQPLMIELQGDHYVQISGGQPSQGQTIDASPRKLLVRSNAAAAPANPNPTAVLIFRDGHRQQVAAYTIAGGTLYANSDYETTGSWNQEIKLWALNVPETIAANVSNGHKFQIPSAPNEVIVGP